MKAIILITTIILIVSSCKCKNPQTRTYEVTYYNGDKETLKLTRCCFHYIDVYKGCVEELGRCGVRSVKRIK